MGGGSVGPHPRAKRVFFVCLGFAHSSSRFLFPTPPRTTPHSHTLTHTMLDVRALSKTSHGACVASMLAVIGAVAALKAIVRLAAGVWTYFLRPGKDLKKLGERESDGERERERERAAVGGGAVREARADARGMGGGGERARASSHCPRSLPAPPSLQASGLSSPAPRTASAARTPRRWPRKVS